MATSPYVVVLNEDDCIVLVIREWLPSAATLKLLGHSSDPVNGYVTQEELWEECEKDMKWAQYKASTPRGPVDEPHLTFACGDDELKEHRYSGKGVPMNPWTKILKAIRDRIYRETGLYCNACLPLCYRTLADSVGFHPDTEVQPPHNVVISVSVGQTRTFILQRNSDKKKYSVELGHGDACIMWGQTQKLFKHAVEKEHTGSSKRVEDPIFKGVRYVATFRQLGGINLKNSHKGPTLLPPKE